MHKLVSWSFYVKKYTFSQLGLSGHSEICSNTQNIEKKNWHDTSWEINHSNQCHAWLHTFSLELVMQWVTVVLNTPRQAGSLWYSWISSQYHGYWCPGSLRRQAIKSHDTDYGKHRGPCLHWAWPATACVILVTGNDAECKNSLPSCKIFNSSRVVSIPIYIHPKEIFFITFSIFIQFMMLQWGLS